MLHLVQDDEGSAAALEAVQQQLARAYREREQLLAQLKANYFEVCCCCT